MSVKKTILSTLVILICLIGNAQTPYLTWVKDFTGASASRGQAIYVDASGNVYTTGKFQGTVDFDPGVSSFTMTAINWDIFVSKIDPNGNFVWAKQFSGSGPEEGWSIAVDLLGNVYSGGGFLNLVDFDPGVGTYTLNSVAGDAYISKLDASGNFLWAKQFGGPSGVTCKSIALDGSGNVYSTGNFNGVTDFDPGPGTFTLNVFGNFGADIFISKLDVSGNFLWAKQMGGSGSPDAGNSIALDGLGNILTTGYFSQTADFDPGIGTYTLTPSGGFTNEIFISKVDFSGNFIWAKQLGGSTSDEGLSIAVDQANNILTTGFFNSTADFDPGVSTYTLASGGQKDIFISKLDAAGNFLWANKTGSFFDDEGQSIATDAIGNVYTTGYFRFSPDFDPGTSTYSLTATLEDAFITKFSSIGNFLWAAQLGGPTSLYERGYGVKCDPSGNVHTTGFYYGTVDFDPTPATYTLNATNENIFVHKMSQSPAGIDEINLNGEINLYPNPTSGEFIISTENITKDSNIEIYNSLGQIVLVKQIGQNKTLININDKPAGIYFVKLISKSKLPCFSKIIKQ